MNQRRVVVCVYRFRTIVLFTIIALISILATSCDNTSIISGNSPENRSVSSINPLLSPSPKSSAQNGTDYSIKTSSNNKNYCNGGEVKIKLNNESKDEILYITRENLKGTEGTNFPLIIKLKIKNSTVEFESLWNDGIYVSTADFDKADKDVDIYITETGTDIDSTTYIYKFDGTKIKKYDEFKHYGHELCYDEKGEIFYWFNDDSKIEINTCYNYKTKSSSKITDEGLLKKLDKIKL
jgi:hypothetical protein